MIHNVESFVALDEVFYMKDSAVFFLSKKPPFETVWSQEVQQRRFFMRYCVRHDHSTKRSKLFAIGLAMVLIATIGVSSAWADGANDNKGNDGKAASKENPPAKPAADAKSAPAAAKPDSAKPAEKAADKPADKPAEKAADKSGDKPTEKTADKPDEKSVGKPGDKSAEKAATKPGDKPTEKSTGKPDDKSAEKAGSKPGDKSAQKTETKPGDNGKATEKTSGTFTTKSSGTATVKSSGTVTEKSSGTATEKSSGTATEKSSGTATDKSDKKADGKSDSSSEKAGDKNGPMSPENKDNVLVWLYKSMGTRYVVIFLIVTFNGIALVVMIILGLRRRYLCPPGLAEGFEVLLDAKEYQKAYMLARRNKSYLGKILTAGMANLCNGYPTAVDAMQDVGEVENLRMEQRNSHMALIAQIGPMLGLLATVDGIVCAFTVIAGKNVTPKPAELAASIGIALVNTIVGLWIAIPSIIFYHIVRNRLSRIVLEVGVISARLMRRFTNSGPVSIDTNAPDADDDEAEEESDTEGEATVGENGNDKDTKEKDAKDILHPV